MVGATIIFTWMLTLVLHLSKMCFFVKEFGYEVYLDRRKGQLEESNESAHLWVLKILLASLLNSTLYYVSI